MVIAFSKLLTEYSGDVSLACTILETLRVPTTDRVNVCGAGMDVVLAVGVADDDDTAGLPRDKPI